MGSSFTSAKKKNKLETDVKYDSKRGVKEIIKRIPLNSSKTTTTTTMMMINDDVHVKL